MKYRIIIFIFVLIMLVINATTPVQADGIIIPEPTMCGPGARCPVTQLIIRYHHVDVNIENQIVKTHVDQVFYNPNDHPIEGVYIFPIPAGASVSDFILWVDGEPIRGEVLGADQARNRYEELVRELKDPALLEYVGRGAIQASVFPIPPQGEQRIELTYNQVLTIANGLIRYDYPLNTEKFSMEPIDSVSVSVKIITEEPIRAVYSSTHSVSVTNENENVTYVSYEGSNVLPDKDFTIYYSVGTQDAFHLFTYRDNNDNSEEDGSFLLLLAPKPDAGIDAIDKDVILVLDHSGSMDGEKFRQAQAATRYILSNLNHNDRFFLLTFNDIISNFAEDLQPALESQYAITWMERMGASGSTDINRALLEATAVVDEERPTYLIFLTDGLPTVGVRKVDDILDNFSRTAPSNLRLFVFGVGYDVDTYLLDTLSQQNHGLSTYVKPEEDLNEILSGFYQRISTPVLTDLELDFGQIKVYDVYPEPLPDLFAGTQLIILGRYKEGGLTDIMIKGKVNGERVRYVHENQIFADGSVDDTNMTEIPRLWATRKIGYLLNNIRLYGPEEENVSQIIKLSIRYGIITPYTSFLVTEPKALGANSQEELAELTFRGLEEAPAAPTSGRDAVEIAAAEGQMSQAEVVESPTQSTSQMVKVVCSRAFVKDGEQWIDTHFDPTKMETIKVAFLSADYFALAQLDDQIGSALALGEQVIFVHGGKAYQIVDENFKGNQLNLEDLIPTQVLSIEEDANPIHTSLSTSIPSNVPEKTTSIVAQKITVDQSYLWLSGGLLSVFFLIILYLIRWA